MNRSKQIRARKSALLATLMLLAFASANAQTTQFTYQGKLSNGGSLANGGYDFQFKLRDTVTLGTGLQVGSPLMLTNITVTEGVFTVQLDFGSSLGLDDFDSLHSIPASDAIHYVHSFNHAAKDGVATVDPR